MTIAIPGKGRVLIFTCYGGCATGVAASKACIRLWEENPDDVKIGGCTSAMETSRNHEELGKTDFNRCLRCEMWRKAYRERGNASGPLHRAYLDTRHQKNEAVTFKGFRGYGLQHNQKGSGCPFREKFLRGEKGGYGIGSSF